MHASVPKLPEEEAREMEGVYLGRIVALRKEKRREGVRVLSGQLARLRFFQSTARAV